MSEAEDTDDGPFIRLLTDSGVREWAPHGPPTYEEWDDALDSGRFEFPGRSQGNRTAFYRDGRPVQIRGERDAEEERARGRAQLPALQPQRTSGHTRRHAQHGSDAVHPGGERLSSHRAGHRRQATDAGHGDEPPAGHSG